MITIGYENKIRQFIVDNHIDSKHLSFDRSCHTVGEAAKTVGTNPDNFVKNICLIDVQGNLIVAIVRGKDRVSATRMEKELGIEKLRMATPDEILNKTGYPVGGIPPFGYNARFLIDLKVMEKNIVYSGGGSENSLIQVKLSVLLATNKGSIAKIRK